MGADLDPVNDHDSRSAAKGIAIPCGIYDTQANRGSVSWELPMKPRLRRLLSSQTVAAGKPQALPPIQPLPHPRGKSEIVFGRRLRTLFQNNKHLFLQIPGNGHRAYALVAFQQQQGFKPLGALVMECIVIPLVFDQFGNDNGDFAIRVFGADLRLRNPLTLASWLKYAVLSPRI